MKPGTSQFRTALIRKLGNIEPDYSVEFFEAENRTIFRMVDQMGRSRSKKITINESRLDGLETDVLRRYLNMAKFHAKSFEE